MTSDVDGVVAPVTPPVAVADASPATPAAGVSPVAQPVLPGGSVAGAAVAPGGGLRTAKDVALVSALAAGLPVVAAARAAGVSRATAHRRLLDPGFSAALDEARSESLTAVGQASIGAALDALALLRAVVRDERQSVRVRLDAIDKLVRLLGPVVSTAVGQRAGDELAGRQAAADLDEQLGRAIRRADDDELARHATDGDDEDVRDAATDELARREAREAQMVREDEALAGASPEVREFLGQLRSPVAGTELFAGPPSSTETAAQPPPAPPTTSGGTVPLGADREDPS